MADGVEVHKKRFAYRIHVKSKKSNSIKEKTDPDENVVSVHFWTLNPTVASNQRLN